MVSAPLGAGNNLSGAGGYGTKGRGGGQAGFGEMKLAGSLGSLALPVGSDAAVTQGLDRDQISSVIARNQGQIRYCYEQGLLQDAHLSGRVTVDFTIGANGLVKAASISQSTLRNTSVEECIVQRLRSWKFPLPDGGVDVKVTYPFTLRRAGQG
jgi:TonB family protein